jgi:hypothetical protein
MTKAVLVNRALRHANLTTIESTDEDNDISAFIAEEFDEIVEEALNAGNFDWPQARRRRTLLQISQTWGNWQYAFDLPDDMVQLHFLVQTDANETDTLAEWEYALFEYRDDADRSGIRVATDYPELDAIYTGHLTSVPYMSNPFAIAVSWLLAHHLSDAFGGAERSAYCYSMYTQKINEAKAHDHRKEHPSVRGEYTLLEDDYAESKFN